MTLTASARLLEEIRRYWNSHIHDLEIAHHEVGTLGFFDDLDEYRFDKLRYLPRLVDFAGFAGKSLLEVGCGVGIDLVRFAKGGAIVTGIDLAEQSIALTRQNFALRGLSGTFLVMNGEEMEFPDNSFDVVYAHGVLQYTADPAKMIGEIHRVLKPGGEAIMMVYNRHSWLRLLSKVMHVGLEHEDAPVLRVFSGGEFRKLLGSFREVRLVCERFPVKTRLHGGLKGVLYNGLFVPAFSLIPKPLIRWSGWHIMAFARK
ncbi:MAG: class I SAM-dependent methyltransferase [bacterium]|jgi:SAM-dependent methyltransferase|nr:class I SAM-dependent methyltransferase [candidate division KSB1 bacterium]MDH7559953.1 class I SAM-dependent methyltransferase [bacterium]